MWFGCIFVQIFLPPFFPQFWVDCVLVNLERKLLSPTKISSLFYPNQTRKIKSFLLPQIFSIPPSTKTKPYSFTNYNTTVSFTSLHFVPPLATIYVNIVWKLIHTWLDNPLPSQPTFSNNLCQCCLETHSHQIKKHPSSSVFGLGVKDLIKRSTRLTYACGELKNEWKKKK